MREEARPKWRELSRQQAVEKRLITRRATHSFERAVFVFRNRERLGSGKLLTFRQMVRHILSPNALSKTLDRVHERERQSLARDVKTKTRALTDNIWQRHRAAFAKLKETQAAERDAQRERQDAGIETIMDGKVQSLADLKPLGGNRPPMSEFDRLMNDPNWTWTRRTDSSSSPVRNLADTFDDAAWRSIILPESGPSRAEQIKRDMEAWRRGHPDHDFGHEL